MTTTEQHHPSPTAPATRSVVAEALRPVLETVIGDPLPLGVRCWDGGTLGPDDAPATLLVRGPDAVRHLLWAPGELGLARAFVTGSIDVEGDLIAGIAALRGASIGPAALPRVAAPVVRAARELGAVGRPDTVPSIEAQPRGRRHGRRRDAQTVRHHYDVGDDFYALVLGPSMTYSCARFAEPTMSLEDAQASKHELVCRKLGLHEAPGRRLLDIGCGWGGMAMHAARHHGARVVGITLSRNQHAWARRAVEAAGLSDLVEIRLADYRELGDERFDAVSSIGMFEHVGAARAAEYFDAARRVLGPGGRMLNHAISSVGGSKLPRRSFMARYVFPDGELHDVGDVVLRMEEAGFEVRDVESLREHYARTVRSWLTRLEQHWDEAVARAGTERARAWRLYLAGSAVGFDDGGINVHQVLGVVPDPDGRSGMPPTRDGWSTAGWSTAR